jgi:hypothetical protein
MNKPHDNQLELVPPEEIVTALGRAGVPPDQAQRIVAAAGPVDDGFNWQTDDSIVVKPRPGVAIYRNKFDDVVIMTQNTQDPDDGDYFAYLREEALPAVIKALKECLR